MAFAPLLCACPLHCVSAGFNSCIVAAPKLHPTAVMSQLLPLLAPSASFVVYSPWVQPLAECLHHLQASRQAVLLQLQESWMRPYQVRACGCCVGVLKGEGSESWQVGEALLSSAPTHFTVATHRPLAFMMGAPQ